MSNQTEWWAPVKSDESVAELFGGERVGGTGEPGGREPRRRSRSSGRKREERLRKQRRRRSVAVLIVALVMVVGAAYVVFSVLGGAALFGARGGSQEAQVEDFPGPGRPGASPVVVNAGDTGAAMAATLAGAGVVATEDAFLDAYTANVDAASIQPGTYQLLLEMKASDAVLALLDAKNRVSTKVTIPEGYTATQIYERIKEVTLIPVDQLQAAAADPAAIGLPAEAGGNVEGWLFPSTYQVEPGTDAAGVLRQMVAKTVEVLSAKGVAQDQWETVLNKASLVEREARYDPDRPKMARAIENRLERDMILQIDAAVAYGLGINGTELTTEMTRDASNPYNTYRHVGLPPTPIASPGEKSIDAVLNPEAGDWIFWTAINLETGETRFAATSDEHDANVELLREWQAANGG
ncbi:endolytic transglycosylase MltG [Cellulomonas shaoxiangyii]|uniref:Endolytic murein transglycosylase n=1 Tax=Cellulomonas shaoxiangyii TaxID=2566013 RepID=A0A4P7SI02_9CELL|nr:endolytic transglycosylase MltG [Cellulomonas shaoxiangyii]QCB93650.1 endolytic transglycosylase MltG [Cellulomonas shaoxiangyii]TGY86131.1 endolytic transglycosylase MltG [Cellulomonas shaoxiangyii]